MMYFFPCGAEIPEGMAILQEGPLLRSGIPGFGPNRIAALSGRYLAYPSVGFSVWAVSEPLVYREGVWLEAKAGKIRVLERKSGDNTYLVAIPQEIQFRKGSSVGTRWCFLLEFEGDLGRERRLAICEAFVRHAVSLFSVARRPEDLSFPATFEVTGK